MCKERLQEQGLLSQGRESSGGPTATIPTDGGGSGEMKMGPSQRLAVGRRGQVWEWEWRGSDLDVRKKRMSLGG